MEADDVKGAKEASKALSQKRIENGKSDKSAVAKDKGKLKDLCLVKISFDQLAKKISKQSGKGVQGKAQKSDLPGKLEIFGRIDGVVQRSNDEHGLTHRKDQLGEPLGGEGINDAPSAAEPTADQE